MTINIEYEADVAFDFEEKPLLEKVVLEALEYEECPYEAEVNIILTDNNSIHEINLEHRGIDAPTDVLSFPMIDYNNPADFTGIEDCVEDYFNPETGELILGDIIISVEKVKSQAEEYGHSQIRELAFLVAHSMMHLFGYDHMVEEESKVMFSKQEEILENLGISR